MDTISILTILAKQTKQYFPDQSKGQTQELFNEFPNYDRLLI